jgi:hypothetical protein
MMREVGIYNTFFTRIWQFMQRNPELGAMGLKMACLDKDFGVIKVLSRDIRPDI